MAGMVFHVYGDKAINREILGVKSRVSDFGPVFRLLRERFYAMEKEAFRTEGASGAHGKWRALAENTVRRKARSRNPRLRPEILQARQYLMKSLTGLGNKGSTSRISRTSFFVGSTIPYGKFHQKPKEGSKLPRRRVIDFNEAEKRIWVKMLQEYMMVGGLTGTMR